MCDEERVEYGFDDWKFIGVREDEGECPPTVWMTRGDGEPDLVVMLKPNEAITIGGQLQKAGLFAAGEEEARDDETSG